MEYEPRELEEIDFDLRQIIPYIQRRESTPRVCAESGMDKLLDERNQREQIIKDFERVFNK
jgi:hypothetical protein